MDIQAKLTDIDLNVQGKKLITQLYEDIKCFITKLSLWKSQLSIENLVDFPMCKELPIAKLYRQPLTNGLIGRMDGPLKPIVHTWEGIIF